MTLYDDEHQMFGPVEGCIGYYCEEARNFNNMWDAMTTPEQEQWIADSIRYSTEASCEASGHRPCVCGAIRG